MVATQSPGTHGCRLELTDPTTILTSSRQLRQSPDIESPNSAFRSADTPNARVSPRPQFDHTGALLTPAKARLGCDRVEFANCVSYLGRGHRMQLREPLSDGGLSIRPQDESDGAERL